MNAAFVLSGGGSLGAVQVGMLPALTERGETPGLIVGTSACPTFVRELGETKGLSRYGC